MRLEISISDASGAIVDGHVSDQTGNDWDLEALWTELKAIYPVGLEISEVLAEAGNRSKLTKEWLTRELVSDAKVEYRKREANIGEAAMRELERRVVLSVVDRKWRDHLYEMDYLKEGIGLRAMAQRDPLVEYQREGYGMFQQMTGAIREETVTYLFNIEVKVAQPAPPIKLMYSAPSEEGTPEVTEPETAPQKPASPAKQTPNSGKGHNPGSSFFKS